MKLKKSENTIIFLTKKSMNVNYRMLDHIENKYVFKVFLYQEVDVISFEVVRISGFLYCNWINKEYVFWSRNGDNKYDVKFSMPRVKN